MDHTSFTRRIIKRTKSKFHARFQGKLNIIDKNGFILPMQKQSKSFQTIDTSIGMLALGKNQSPDSQIKSVKVIKKRPNIKIYQESSSFTIDYSEPPQISYNQASQRPDSSLNLINSRIKANNKDNSYSNHHSPRLEFLRFHDQIRQNRSYKESPRPIERINRYRNYIKIPALSAKCIKRATPNSQLKGLNRSFLEKLESIIKLPTEKATLWQQHRVVNPISIEDKEKEQRALLQKLRKKYVPATTTTDSARKVSIKLPKLYKYAQ
eukprot:TRINITY_DN135_c1_g1_i1.p4 TRINITY_DN135_c1_g1~~TRINITY_DN135_c1_g1_i1.p4  ORF type:complete len:299 (-),score=9.32 TRINITY_DN135_c1_g1_i1:5796-6593(-)